MLKGLLGLGNTHILLSWFTGNLSAFVLFVSPIPTFRRIIRNGSTEQFSGLPYIYALLNCLICLWYGMPLVSPGIILVATVNSVGAIFQLIYIGIFITFAEKAKKMKMSGLLTAIFGIYAIIVFASMKLFDPHARQLFVGYLSVASLISMFASPLFIIVPNGIGTILGVVQLVLYAYYSRTSTEDLGLRESFIESYA
ncbi:Bidirectional sugar transporter SWEET2a [Vitis vinifera]|uniref:Bidirectional sugar transporter SWEET2a n=1 Tax=Vitis vinifera TaxID=29760 RepID=A0A438D286_VITVI|nr:Bidirectional sugar transporter SWEET2a [Vitis vinifera]